MAAHAGPLPWTKEYATYKYEGRGSKSAAKNAYKTSGRRWNPGSFHMEGTTKVWDEDPRWERNLNKGRGKTANWGDFTANGRVDPGELTAEYKKSKTLSHTSSAADYVDYSFNVDKDNVTGYEGCGHIAQFEYNSATLTLRVTFTNNGNVVAYFGVPSVVVGELIYAAKTKQTQYSMQTGNEVHTLGVRFWDLIRIRGSIHGSRYEFTYVADNGTGGEYAGGWGHESRPSRVKGQQVYADTDYVDIDMLEDIMEANQLIMDNSGNIVIGKNKRPKQGYLPKAVRKIDAKNSDDSKEKEPLRYALTISDKETGEPIIVTAEQRAQLGEAYAAGEDPAVINKLINKFIAENKA